MKRTIVTTEAAIPNGGEGYFPQDIKRLYNIPDELTGEGQTIGILEFSNGYNLRDAEQFWRMHGISSPQVTFVSIDGTANDGGRNADDEEATLDLQWAGAIAPGAHIIVYEADGASFENFAQSVTKTLQYILNDTQYHPSILSISYGDAEISFNSAEVRQWGDLISKLDSKGITVCISSGDQGAYGLHNPNGPKTRHADGPATAPMAIAVGGTSIQPDGTETAWTFNTDENMGATGGGFSSIFAKPDYQNNISNDTRGIPDISCNADPLYGYQIIFQGQKMSVGGTSVSCPVFAAVIALANQRRKQQGMSSLSSLVKILYSNGIQSAYRDITVGNNSYNDVIGYEAETGWDACTGFGSFDATKLIEYLSKQDVSQLSNPELIQEENQILPTPPKNDQEVIVRVKAVIQKVESDAHRHGVSHHHLLVNNIQVLKVWNATQMQIDSSTFVAIRYGDSRGLKEPIPDLSEGKIIELQGRYIPKNNAHPDIGNPGDPVIDETHNPFGFVIYEGNLYE
ncbi:S53 family peptidase [Bacillus cereus]|uniref:S53 family peptidase n=1 Tax=Bacillus cereus TaxID=1396 RepID=UPI0011226D84|nr:S53 family peptidase [Bacillus cereus]QDD83827.1 Kumamolysin [Bacillus cereus]